jgi:hypothetical protein
MGVNGIRSILCVPIVHFDEDMTVEHRQGVWRPSTATVFPPIESDVNLCSTSAC